MLLFLSDHHPSTTICNNLRLLIRAYITACDIVSKVNAEDGVIVLLIISYLITTIVNIVCYLVSLASSSPIQCKIYTNFFFFASFPFLSFFFRYECLVFKNLIYCYKNIPFCLIVHIIRNKPLLTLSTCHNFFIYWIYFKLNKYSVILLQGKCTKIQTEYQTALNSIYDSNNSSFHISFIRRWRAVTLYVVQFFYFQMLTVY